MGQYEGSMPSQFLQHVLGRRNRSFALTGVVLLLLATITWMYGGFAGSSLAVPPDQFVTPKPVDHNTNTGGQAQEEEPEVDESKNWPKPSDGPDPNDRNPWPTHAPSSTSATPSTAAAKSTPSTPAANAEKNPDVVGGGIPPKIWQILLPKKIKKPEDAKILTDPRFCKIPHLGSC